MSKAEAEAWCGPTRELDSSHLRELLHQTKPEPPRPVPVDEDAWFCKTNEVPASTKELTGPVVVARATPEPLLIPMPASMDPLPGSRLFGRRTGSRKPVYPVYQANGSVRIAIGIAVIAMIAIAVLMTLAV